MATVPHKPLPPEITFDVRFSILPLLNPYLAAIATKEGFYVVLDDLAIRNAYIIIPEGNHYPLDERVTFSSLQYFLKELLPVLV